ncbi:MAG: Ig-like domain-containing protein [Balneolales bacterium]
MQKALYILSTLIILYGCATPSQPTGGPRDTTGPEIIVTNPESGTVNYKENRISFEFSDYVERSSFQEAFRIEPDLGIDYELDWGRRSVHVDFEQDLPESTTVIFTVGTDLTDTRNNNMSNPFQLALSTGPDIDNGSISAVVLDAETGEPTEGARVFLYRAPYDLTEKANYSVETDTAGVASFNYLSEGGYRGMWVDDRNRNQIWEPPREEAQPFPTDTLQLDRDGSADFGTLYVTQTDTTSPELSAVGLLSSTRMRLRFTEGVEIRQDAAINISTLTGEPYSDGIPLYVDQADNNLLFAQSSEAFVEEEYYQLELEGITDASGNAAYSNLESFSGSGEVDTTMLSYREHKTASGIYANDPLIFEFSKIIEDDVVIDSLKVVENETLHEVWPRTEIVNNNIYIQPDTIWQQGNSYEVRLWDPSQAGYVNIEPVIWHDEDLGEIDIVLEETSSGSSGSNGADTTETADTGGAGEALEPAESNDADPDSASDTNATPNEAEISAPVAQPDTAITRYSLYDDYEQLIREGTFRESVNVSQLPPQDYKLVVFQDIDGSGTWDSGQVQPYRAPEPYFIQTRIPVQANLAGQVYVNFDTPGSE